MISHLILLWMTLFFDELLEAEEVLRPLSKASFIMQHDRSTLADVLNMFGLLYQSFQKSCHSTKLLSLLEKRWKQQEQPIFLLASFFDPKYVGMFRTMSRFKRNLDITSTIQYCLVYYKKFVVDLTGAEFNQMSKEVNDWYNDHVKAATLQVSFTPTEFWKALQGRLPLLSRLALFVLSIVVQTATCERLFSTFGHFATKK